MARWRVRAQATAAPDAFGVARVAAAGTPQPSLTRYQRRLHDPGRRGGEAVFAGVLLFFFLLDPKRSPALATDRVGLSRLSMCTNTEMPSQIRKSSHISNVEL